MIAYHVDRLGRLSTGKRFDLLTLEIDDTWLREYILSLYPGGISFHGKYYIFSKSENPQNLSSFQIEALYEEVRKQHFPHRLSRFQSFFACSTIHSALKWYNSFDKAQFPDMCMWEIQVDESNLIELDSSLLIGGFSNHNYYTTIKCAHDYWEGKMSSSPKTELLIKPPFTVTKKINVQ